MVFQPMLPEVISASVGVADTVSPIRRIVPRAILHMRDVEAVDLKHKTVTCSPGFRPRPLVLPFDHLVLALGTVTDFYVLTGLAEHAMAFNTLGDALALRNHVIHILEEADTEPDADLRKQLFVEPVFWLLLWWLFFRAKTAMAAAFLLKSIRDRSTSNHLSFV